MVVAQRLRKGSAGSPRGAKRLVTDALKTVRALSSGKPLVRADSAFYGRGLVGAALRAGADVSVTVRLDPKVKAAIAAIPDDAWEPIEYTDAVYDEATDRWISRAEVAEISFTAFSAQKKADQVPGRRWSAASPTSTPPRGRAPSSRSGASTPSSPPPTQPCRHRGRGQDPPAPCGHRAGPRRPEELRAGAPALSCLEPCGRCPRRA